MTLTTALLLAVATALSPNGPASPNPCDTGTIPFNFVNECTYDIWLGEFGPGTAGILPTSGTWQINAGSRATVCIPSSWSGRFWPRTGCTGTGSTLNCVTGQCGGTWPNLGTGYADCTAAGKTGFNPQAIFEVTVGGGSANYDVSLANGYNVQMWVTTDGNGCEPDGVGCGMDLLASCPAALQMIMPPTASGDPDLPCGTNTYCPSGRCLAGSQCLVGCFYPSDACLNQASSVTPLKCASAVPGATGTDCSGNAINSVPYLAVYMAKNYGGLDAGGNSYTGDNYIMGSVNLGTPTCFGPRDCPLSAPDCVTTGFPSGYTPPAGAGVCLDLAEVGYAPCGTPSNSYCGGTQTNCSSTNVGTACGGDIGEGFADGLGYTCQPVTYTQAGGGNQTAYACLPPLTNGLGACDKSGSPWQYPGVAGVTNPAWMTAAVQAGANGKPFYQIYQEACPNTYYWQYDDQAADFTCANPSSFTTYFCPKPRALAGR